MKFSRLLTILTFLAVFAMAAKVSIDSDTWWHLRAGKWMFENRAILTYDPFSFTRYQQAWLYPGWLAEIPMYGVYRTFGYGGLNLWTALMISLAFVFIWYSCQGNLFLRAFSVIIAAAASGIYWSARPHLFTFLLSAIFLYLLRAYYFEGKYSRGIWYLPVLMLIWVNSHGGFILGYIIFGIFFLQIVLDGFTNTQSANPAGRWLQVIRSKSVRNLSAIGVVMVFASIFNPMGIQTFTYPFTTVGITSLQNFIEEWQSPNFHKLAFQPFIWLLLLLILSLSVKTKKIKLCDFLLVSAGIYLALLSSRNIVFFALITPGIITRYFPIERLDLPNQSSQARAKLNDQTASFLNAVILVLFSGVVFIKAAAALPPSINQVEIEKNFPVKAVNYIREHQLAGRIFNSYNWGGYLVWSAPDFPVFVDGRTDLYNDAILDDWWNVYLGKPGWDTILNTWRVNLILLEKDSPVLYQMEHNHWELVYSDQIAAILIRK